MSEERLKEIKDSLDTPVWILTQRIFAKSYMEIHLQQELELYNEVVRLREIIKEAIKDVEENQIQNEYTDRGGFRVKENKWWLEDSDILLGILKQYNLTLEQLGEINDNRTSPRNSTI